MKMRTIIFRPLTSHPYSTGTKHARISPARLRFARVILATSHHHALRREWGSAIGFWTPRIGSQEYYIRQA